MLQSLARGVDQLIEGLGLRSLVLAVESAGARRLTLLETIRRFAGETRGWSIAPRARACRT